MGLPRIIYNSINVDFLRHFNELEIYPIEKKFENESAGGIIETLDFFERYYIRALKERLSASEIDQLRRWYTYVKDGTSFSMYFDRNLVSYLSFEGKSTDTNNGTLGTFARTGAAYTIDPYTGLLTSIAEDIPRFMSGKFGAGLLIERATTNLLTKSEEFDDVAWVKSNVTVNADTSETADPAGGNDADKLTASAANGTITYTTATAIGTNDGTFSIFLKAESQLTDNVVIYLKDDSPATLATETITVTPQWQRFDVNFATVGNNANNWVAQLEIVNNSDIIYAFGAQLETIVYPTGYVKTEAATASRNAEKIYYEDTIGQLQGTISFWFYAPWAYDIGSARYLMNAIDSSNADVLVIKLNTHGYIEMELYDASGTEISEDEDGSTINEEGWNHVVCTYDMINGRATVYLNGVGTTANANPSTLKIFDKLYIGSSDTPDNHADCIFDEIEIYSEVKSASWVTQRYNATYAQGIRKNYFSALILDDTSFNPILSQGMNKYKFELNAKEVLT